MIVENRKARAHLDLVLISLVAVMCFFGVLAVAVATYSPDSTSGASLLNHIVESSYAMRQCLFLLIAPVIISVALAIPFDFFKRYTVHAYIFGNVLLLVTLVTNGAQGVKAWTDIVWGYTIQPSEFIKLAMILMMARVLNRMERPLHTLSDWLELGIVVGIPAIIVLASGEMGSLMVVVFMVAVMLFFAGVDWKYIFLLVGVATLAILAIYGYAVASGSDSYRLQRILAFFNPEDYASTDAYQQQQSMTCIGSGGLFGKGQFVDGSWSQLNYVPADWTDFIFATIGEAYGFIGCCAVLGCYLAIILRMLYLAKYTRDRYGMLVIIGVMSMLLFHVFENIAMTTGRMPITGIPLPFLSYGGSNMVTNIGGVALVLMVTKNRSLTSSIQTPQRVGAVRYYAQR